MTEEDPLINRSNSSNSITCSLQEVTTCRICLEEDKSWDMIAPCRCTGSSKYVHIVCLNEWRASATNQEAFNRCFTCNYTYQTQQSNHKLGFCASLNLGHPKFYCGIYVLNFVVILIFGSIFQLIDTHRRVPAFFNEYLNPLNWIKYIPSNIPVHYSNLTLSQLFNSTSTATDSTTSPATLSPYAYSKTLSMFDVFDYYSLGSYIYFGLVLLAFGITLARVKNRGIYFRYLVGSPWYIALIRVISVICLTVLTLTTSTLLGCFVMTCVIQTLMRHHYNYINEYYRALSTVILEYNPDLDIQPRQLSRLPV